MFYKIIALGTIKSLSEIPVLLKPLNWPVHHFKIDQGGMGKHIVLLGEHHMVDAIGASIAPRLAGYFEAVGLEGVDLDDRRINGFKRKMNRFERFTKFLTFGKLSQRSPISYFNQFKDNYAYQIFRLEKNWRATSRLDILSVSLPYIILLEMGLYPILRPFKISLYDEAFIWAGLVHERDQFMANNINEMVQGSNYQNYLVVTGADHTPGIVDLLVTKYGFVKQQFEEE